MPPITNKALRGYKPPKGYETVRLEDMSGGLNTEVPADLLADNESPVSQFVDRSLKGIAKVANGRVARFASQFASAGLAGMGGYVKSDGTTRLMMAVGAQLYTDLPHLKFAWATQADFSAAGTTADKTVSEPPGGGLTLQVYGTWADIKANFATWQAVLNESLGT